MRDLTTFFQICIYITVTMVIFTLVVNFVSGLGVFPIEVEAGFQEGENSSDTFSGITNLDDTTGSEGIESLWNLVLGAGAGLGVGLFLGWAMHSTSLIGVSLFAGIFWSSYINALSILTSLARLNTLSDYGFIAIGTVGMLFIFSGAVAGMLSGSG